MALEPTPENQIDPPIENEEVEESKENKLRGVATIVMYVYGNSKEDLIEAAIKLTEELNDKYDCNAAVEELGIHNHGDSGYKKIS